MAAPLEAWETTELRESFQGFCGFPGLPIERLRHRRLEGDRARAGVAVHADVPPARAGARVRARLRVALRVGAAVVRRVGRLGAQAVVQVGVQAAAEQAARGPRHLDLQLGRAGGDLDLVELLLV